MKNLILVNLSTLVSWAACTGSSPTWSSTPDQTSVVSCVASASAGDTINVSAGSASWSGITINKELTITGAGVGQTNITLTGSNSVTKQAGGVIRISGFSFSKSGGGNESKGWIIGGNWTGTEPVIFDQNEYTISGSGLFRLECIGGVIIANSNFIGAWDDSFIQPKATGGSESWTTADTMGMEDSTGKLNLYIETNTFYGGTNQGIDCDENTRCVYRHNDLTYSSFNSHGLATGPASVRHWEIYENNFQYIETEDQIGAMNWLIWIRGATGVIFNNTFDDIAGSYWGDKNEIHFSLRGAEDARAYNPAGPDCEDVSYPMAQQIGGNHNGSSYFTDPVYIWGNTGAQAIEAGWNWGNPCGLTFSDFWQEDRDYVIGTAKPGYAAYTYPHPLLSDGGGTAPTITTTTLPGGQVAVAYSETLAATGDTPITWTCCASGSLPGGLSLESDGDLVGTPTADGTFNFTVTATNGTGNDTQALSVDIDPAPISIGIAGSVSISGGTQ